MMVSSMVQSMDPFIGIVMVFLKMWLNDKLIVKMMAQLIVQVIALEMVHLIFSVISTDGLSDSFVKYSVDGFNYWFGDGSTDVFNDASNDS